MSSVSKPKETSYEYGKAYQLAQAEKYRCRHENHWHLRIELAERLVKEYVTPMFSGVGKENIVVVDVGCSIGTFALEFAREGYRAYGVDFDESAIEVAMILSEEEKVSAEFLCKDVSALGDDFPPVDIAVCFDIFEHLHDDELGGLLQGIRRMLSEKGYLVFHTFPTEYDYLFYTDEFNLLGRRFLYVPLLLFRKLSPTRFSRIVRAYATFLDLFWIITKGMTYRQSIKAESHCNPMTKERLTDILERNGYEILTIQTSQVYPYEAGMKKRFSNQPMADRNIFGVAAPKKRSRWQECSKR